MAVRHAGGRCVQALVDVSSSDFRQIAERGDRGKKERLFRAAITAFCSLTRPSRNEIAKLIKKHLGVGSDMDLNGYDAMPPELNKQLRAGYKGSYGFREKIDIEGLDHPKRMFDLTEGLIRRKYTDPQIEGILGGNFRRVLSEIWTV